MDCQQIAKTVGWLGETWGFWIQTGAFLISALAGVAVIYYNGKQGRTRALIDLMIHQKTDTELLAATSLVFKLHRENAQFSNFVRAAEPSPEKSAILKVLNNHEFIALGIRQRAFDEKIYKRMQCSNVLKVWDSARGFIHEVRRIEGRDTFFQELEHLAERWKKKPIQPKR
ncbi:DUF4760 domain-containing protein [Burkholderia vietnamiensis]|uniref:DUF4760 domain-containing protein n=1 Tax=Burkholderia vietnamiensis TaxID=60552 RepID=UPI001CF5F01A|nr:DUF4760 domain-containing protein [Burkholderia vietnamiensis]MCA8391469.1 DUF4760 domain-containing protein [Burkholderia vietnamiensis]HDR8957064.1 DUF4760 domain-containing protein [Burkholderia vietnamiensis]HDR9243693.1 DUF4760 domain-containing protein [Burkholderia vietnamiensis]